jgi:hypothetical protein
MLCSLVIMLSMLQSQPMQETKMIAVPTSPTPYGLILPAMAHVPVPTVADKRKGKIPPRILRRPLPPI